MSVATPLFNPTLESVQHAFDHWRATRSKRTRTPISLQHRAAALLHSHPASRICSALKINDTALKRWAQEPPRKTPSTSASETALVELPAEPTQSVHPDSASAGVTSVSINVGDTIELRVHGHLTLEQILCAARQHQQGACS